MNRHLPLPMYMKNTIGEAASEIIPIAGRIEGKGERVQAYRTMQVASDMTVLLMQNISVNIDLDDGDEPIYTLDDLVAGLTRAMSKLGAVIERLSERDHHDLAAELQEQLEKLQRELRDNARMLEGKA